MRLTFIHPELLWLLLLLPPMWALALLGPHKLAGARRWASLALRTAIMLGLIGALAGTQAVRRQDTTTTIFLLDGSDSVALSQRAQAEGFIQSALAAMPNEDAAGVVVFGSQALVERAPQQETTLGQIAAHPAGSASDIASAIQLGLSMLPQEGHQRLVLLSDGGENRGDAQAAARIAAERGIPIDIVPLNGLPDGLDAQVSRVRLPASARVGQQLRLQMTLESTQATAGQLRIEGPDGQVLVNQRVDLPQGSADMDVVLPPPTQQFSRYTVRLSVEGDVRPENNAAEAYTFITGRPRVLLAEGSPDAAKNLAGALASSGIEVSVIKPQALPESIGQLAEYDAVALIDTPKRAVSARAQSALATFVHDLGRGLIMVGGTQAFGAGSWRDTPIEAALPVDMDIPTQYEIPPVSIVVLIDTSGSMSQEEDGKTKLQLAADGAAQIATLMRDSDEITVIPFDEAPGQVVGPIPGSRRNEAVSLLSKMEPGGGGINIFDGLSEVERRLSRTQMSVKHIITITDGADTEQQEGAIDIIKRLRGQQVTLTSIAIGDGKDVPFLQGAVHEGGGRFFLTTKASELPSILADETQAVVRPYVVEEDFTPGRINDHPILRAIDGVPKLQGRVVTTPKQTAQVLMNSERGDPVLAVWQYGLGRSAAWTSDLGGRWANGWTTWEGYQRFCAQLVGWLLPAREDSGLALQTETVNGQLLLEAQASNTQQQARSGLTITARLLRGDQPAVEVPLSEVGPGRYRAAVSDAAPGAYLVQLEAKDSAGATVGLATAGAAVPQSAEYQTRNANPALLSQLAQISGGRQGIAPAEAFAPNLRSQGAASEIALALLALALALLPFDIAIRRLFGRRGPTLATAPRSAWALPPIPKTLKIPTPSAPAAPKAVGKEAELEKLRAAQEQARKRARGEE
ncbi:VWA domain-containing protein [Chloroflexia bacterium SDU3-3]|nr:VWA domain-containing protein [Chloroflexia bacterium SDU3-3]